MHENKMGYMPVNRLLVSMSIPMMLSMLVQALYNIVDSMFVAQISEYSLTAVSLAFPFQNLMISVGVGTGVGVNSLLSRLLGEKKREEAAQTAANGIFLAICGFVLFATLGTLCVRPFFEMQTDITEIIEGGTSYLSICTLFSLGLFMATMLEKLLASTGKTVYTMLAQMTGAITNIVLDPIMIFGLFGMPAMGIAGAAIATVIGQYVSFFTGFYLNHFHNEEIRFSWSGFRPSRRLIRRIYGVGLPSIIMSSVGSVMTFGMNQILIPFSTTTAAVFGVYFKLQSFVFMPLFGMNNGLIPIVAFNFGAALPRRIMAAFRWALIYAAGIMAIGTILFEFFPVQLLSIFNASAHMIEIGVPALRIIASHFLIAAIGIECSGMFQALGHGMYSLWASLLRQLVVLLPVAWIMSLSGNLDLIWLAFPISEVFSMAFCVFFMRRIYVRQIKPLMKS